MTLDDFEPMVTVREAADMLRISPFALKKWIKKGRLSATRINARGDMRLKKKDVEELLKPDL